MKNDNASKQTKTNKYITLSKILNLLKTKEKE